MIYYYAVPTKEHPNTVDTFIYTTNEYVMRRYFEQNQFYIFESGYYSVDCDTMDEFVEFIRDEYNIKVSAYDDELAYYVSDDDTIEFVEVQSLVDDSMSYYGQDISVYLANTTNVMCQFMLLVTGLMKGLNNEEINTIIDLTRLVHGYMDCAVVADFGGVLENLSNVETQLICHIMGSCSHGEFADKFTDINSIVYYRFIDYIKLNYYMIINPSITFKGSWVTGPMEALYEKVFQKWGYECE